MRTEHFTWQDLGLLLYKLGEIERSVPDDQDGDYKLESLIRALQGSCLSEKYLSAWLERENHGKSMQDLLGKDLSEMPLFINDDRQFAREIAKWRLEINK